MKNRKSPSDLRQVGIKEAASYFSPQSKTILPIAFTTNMESSAKTKAVKRRKYKANNLHINSISSKGSPLSSRSDNIAEEESNEEDIDDLSFLHELISNLVDERNDENDEDDRNENQYTSIDNFTNAMDDQSCTENSSSTDTESSCSPEENDCTDEDFEDTDDSDASGKIHKRIIE